MEVLGAPSTFRFPFFSLPNNKKLAFRRPPPAASAPFRSPPPPYLSHAPPPQRHANRRLAVPCSVHPAPPAPVEDEARAILRHFLKEDDGMRSALEEQKALEIVELLSSKLRSLHESEQQLGVQLSQPQLIDLFTPYLRSILKEYGDILIVGGDDQLPSAPPGWEKKAGEVPTGLVRYKRKVVAQLKMQLSEGSPSPHVLYLMNLGLDLRRIWSMVRSYPLLKSATIKQKLDRVVEFLVSLGLPKSDVAQVLYKCPRLIGLKIEKNMVPSMALLESKGVDKAQWLKIINRQPIVLIISKAKIEAVIGYFSEMGLLPTEIGRLLTHNPQVLCLSIEAKIKPTDRFLLDIGFTMEEIHAMLLKTGNIYNLSLERNLKPKWDFLLMMGYPKSELLRFPAYFTYSLDGRIKPRYELAVKHGIRFSLASLLVASNEEFENTIQRKMHD